MIHGVCKDKGFIFAWKKDTPLSAPFVFKCDCAIAKSSSRNFPVWNQNIGYVPEFEDERPTERWIIEEIDAGRGKSPEFKRRVEIWGRDWFENVWSEEKKRRQTNKNDSQTVLGSKLTPNQQGSVSGV